MTISAISGQKRLFVDIIDKWMNIHDKLLDLSNGFNDKLNKASEGNNDLPF